MVRGDVDHDPIAAARGALLRRKDALDLDAAARRARGEAAGRPQQVGQGLARAKLVDRRTDHLARHRHARPVHWHEHDVAGLKADVVRGVSAEQVVIDIERVHQLAGAADFHAPQRSVLGGSARRVQRRERGARARHLVAAWAIDIADHEYLVGAQPGNAQREACGGSGTPPDP